MTRQQRREEILENYHFKCKCAFCQTGTTEIIQPDKYEENDPLLNPKGEEENEGDEGYLVEKNFEQHEKEKKKKKRGKGGKRRRGGGRGKKRRREKRGGERKGQR
eukprot:TRINITY_DN2459_c0_g2_i4.p1 TRINITY_DN2459_c0_g2~~TRINITY_DN2459_c0_g2_i4.p1  ORF type:complete len:105 (-),score=23.26 TRINITY_DN2459_c0_g2_i4:2-316(-)